MTKRRPNSIKWRQAVGESAYLKWVWRVQPSSVLLVEQQPTFDSCGAVNALSYPQTVAQDEENILCGHFFYGACNPHNCASPRPTLPLFGWPLTAFAIP